MIVVTTFDVSGYEITEVMGMVRGNAVRTRGIGYDILAGIRSIFGGQVRQYEALLQDTREFATNQMIAEAEAFRCERHRRHALHHFTSRRGILGNIGVRHRGQTQED